MSHMGLVLLGAAAAVPLAINGAVLTMLADGLSASLLLLLAAAIIERANTSSLRAMGGLAGRMSRSTVLWVLAALAAAGFPGLASFVGQLLVALVGAFLALATQFKQTITILDGAFTLDGFAVVVDVVLLVAAGLAVLASKADVLPGESPAAAVPGFFLLATLGALLAASAAEMVSVFLSLE